MVCEPPTLLPIYSPSGAGKGRVPWTELQRAQGSYIKPKYLPKQQVTLRQYYHICREDTDALLEHWTRRQAAGKVPLRFRKVVRGIGQNERTSEENHANGSTERGDEAEDDHRYDSDGQPRGDRASQRDGSTNGSTGQAHPGQSPGDVSKNPSRVG